MKDPSKSLGTPAAVLFFLGLAALLRIPWLGVLPNPAGDEGNWTIYALRLVRHQPVALAPEARFVTLAFAHLIAMAFRIGGASFTSARAVLVTASIVGVALVWPLAKRVLGTHGAGIVAGVLAVHPWAVLWSRTVAVPYALVLVLSTLGPLGIAVAVQARSALGFVVAAQVLAVGMNFSPLALLPIVACALWMLKPTVRAQLPRWAWILAVLLAMLQWMPLAVGVFDARSAMAASAQHGFASQAWTPRLLCFLRMVLGELSGEATAAHFAGRVQATEIAGALLTIVVAVVAIPSALRLRLVGSLAVLYLAIAFAGLPLLLLPGRAWHMPTIDAERYGFALIAPFALVLERGAHQRAGRVAAGVFVVWLLCVPTARSAAQLIAGIGGTGDQGLEVMHGGGRYRGWQAPQGHLSLPERIRADVLRLAGGAHASVVYEDYAFHPIRFVNAVAWDGKISTSLGLTPMPQGALEFTVLWSDGILQQDYQPEGIPLANRALRDRVLRLGGQRVEVIAGRGGRALCEIWRNRAP